VASAFCSGPMCPDVFCVAYARGPVLWHITAAADSCVLLLTLCRWCYGLMTDIVTSCIVAGRARFLGLLLKGPTWAHCGQQRAGVGSLRLVVSPLGGSSAARMQTINAMHSVSLAASSDAPRQAAPAMYPAIPALTTQNDKCLYPHRSVLHSARSIILTSVMANTKYVGQVAASSWTG
jgi:hypothetical protein